MMTGDSILDQAFDLSPVEIEHLYEQAGKRWNINPALLRAQNSYELGPNGNARTAGDAQHVGYGQLGPAMRAKYQVSDASDPQQAIFAQAHALRDLVDKHKGDLHGALTEYTGGPNRSSWGPHTQAYAEHVLSGMTSGAGHEYEPDPLDAVWKAEQPAAPAEQTHHPAQASYPWGATKDIVNGMDLGYGPEIHGAVAAGRGLASRLASGMSLSDAMKGFQKQYSAERDWALQGRAEHAKESPLGSMLYEGLGSAVPTTAALATGQAELAEPLAARISAAAPGLSRGIAGLASEAGLRGWLARRAGQAVAGAGMGGLTAAMTSHMSPLALGQQLKQGAVTGAVLNPALSSAIEPLLSHISPVVASAVQRLRDLGVNVPAGRVAGASPILQGMEKIFGQGGSGLRQQLTSALDRAIGGQGQPLTRDVMNAHEDRISQGFKTFAGLAQDANLNDPVLKHDIISTLTDASKERISDEGLDKLKDIAGLIHADGKPLNGADYLQLTKRGGQLDRLLRDPEIGEHAINLRDALDDSLQRQVQSGFGKWMPGQGQAPTTSPASLAKALSGEPPRPALGVGLPEGFDSTNKPNFTSRSNQPLALRGGTPSGPGYQPNWTSGPAEGTIENGPHPPQTPGMEWQYTPGGEGLVNELRNLRAQWRNLKITDPVVNDTTGEVDPSRLASAVDRGYKRSARASLAPASLDMLALGQGDNFIPKGGDKPGMLSSLWDKFSDSTHGAGPIALAMGLYPTLAHEAANLEANWKPLLLGAGGLIAGTTAGRGINSIVNGSRNTARILENAAAERGTTALPFIQTLMGPTVHFMNQPDSEAVPGTYDPNQPPPAGPSQ